MKILLSLKVKLIFLKSNNFSKETDRDARVYYEELLNELKRKAKLDLTAFYLKCHKKAVHYKKKAKVVQKNERKLFNKLMVRLFIIFFQLSLKKF